LTTRSLPLATRTVDLPEMTFTDWRSALLALVVTLPLVGTAFAAKTWILGTSGSPPDSPVAQTLYWRTLQQLAARPRFLLTEASRQQLPPDMTPMRTGGSISTLYRIRHPYFIYLQEGRVETLHEVR